MISPKNHQKQRTQLGDFIVITTVERNGAAARWKEMMEKDFDIDYVPGIDQPSPEMRTAAAQEYAAYQLGQINRKLDKIIGALGSTS
jgi:hypothetical protein